MSPPLTDLSDNALRRIKTSRLITHLLFQYKNKLQRTPYFSKSKLLRAIIYCSLWAFHFKRWQAKWALGLETWDLTGRKKARSLWKRARRVLKPPGLWFPQWWVWAACDVEKRLHAQSALFGLIKQKAVMSASCWQNWLKPSLPWSCSALCPVQLCHRPPWLLKKRNVVWTMVRSFWILLTFFDDVSLICCHYLVHSSAECLIQVNWLLKVLPTYMCSKPGAKAEIPGADLLIVADRFSYQLCAHFCFALKESHVRGQFWFKREQLI